MTFRERQKYADSKKSVVAIGDRREECGAQRIFRAVQLFCVTPQWWIPLSKSIDAIECTPPSVNPNVNYGLG